ncbi:MAG: hypothetical protein Q7V05_04985 [Methanoregula sp.]|nr:hypothetical protein [Methanoregula sp.]
MTPAPARIAESHVEEHALAWLRELGYTTLFGPDITPGEPRAERDSWHDVILKHRLAAAIARLNPDIPADAQEVALKKDPASGLPVTGRQQPGIPPDACR